MSSKKVRDRVTERFYASNAAAAQASKKKVRKLTTFRIQEKGPATSLSKNQLWKKQKKKEKRIKGNLELQSKIVVGTHQKWKNKYN